MTSSGWSRLNMSRMRRTFCRQVFLLFAVIVLWSLKWCFFKSFSLFLSFLFKCTIGRYDFANVWIWTADLRCQKRPLYQLSHYHCPLNSVVIALCCCHSFVLLLLSLLFAADVVIAIFCRECCHFWHSSIFVAVLDGQMISQVWDKKAADFFNYNVFEVILN